MKQVTKVLHICSIFLLHKVQYIFNDIFHWYFELVIDNIIINFYNYNLI